jgi:3-isopropylmalate dehydrogenase
VIAGSIGLLPSASVGPERMDGNGRRFGLYEPIHGSAPDIAGQGRANPVGMILSVAAMLRLSLGLEAAATAVEAAVAATLEAGYRTADVSTGSGPAVSTAEVGAAVAERVAAGAPSAG